MRQRRPISLDSVRPLATSCLAAKVGGIRSLIMDPDRRTLFPNTTNREQELALRLGILWRRPKSFPLGTKAAAVKFSWKKSSASSWCREPRQQGE
jgi:hypothetical protein